MKVFEVPSLELIRALRRRGYRPSEALVRDREAARRHTGSDDGDRTCIAGPTERINTRSTL